MSSPVLTAGVPFRLTIPADLSRLAEARAWIGEIAGVAALSDARSFDLRVAVSEATANAIEHAASGVELVAYLLPDRLIVEIVNDGVFQPGLYKDDEHRRRGLGLPLMVSLADQVHVSGLAQSRTRVSLTFFLESYSHWDSPQPGFVEGTEIKATTREAEDRYRKLVDLSPDAILVNLSGAYVFANPAAAKLLGAGSPSELVGRSVLRHVHPDDRALVAERTGQILSGAVAPPREIRLLRLDGTPVLAEVTGSRVEFGGRLAVQAVMRDITERRRVEEEINDLSQLLTYHMEHSPLAVIEWGPDMKLRRWSGEAERIFGWRVDEVLGKRIEDFRWVHEDDFPQVSEVSEELQDGTNPRRFSINRNYHKDGSVVYCEWHNSSLLDESGNLKSILSLVLDVTERKRAEELLRASEERFRTMADAIPQLAWIAHADGSIYWYNKRWYEYTGTTLAEMEGWGWQKVHDPQVLPAVLASWEVSIATGQPFSMEFPLRGADGEFRPFLTYAMPLRDEAGHVVQWFGTNTDISEQKRAEEARRKGEERLSSLLSSAGRLRLIERQNAWPVLLVGIVAQFALFFGVDQLGSPSHYLGLPGAATALIGVCAAVLAGPSLGVIVSLAGGLAYFVFLTDLGTAVAWAAIVVSILLWALASAAAGMAADFVRRNALLREKSLRRMLVERETLTQSLGLANESLHRQNEDLAAQSERMQVQNEDLDLARRETERLLSEQRTLFRRLQESPLDIPRELPGVQLAHLYRSATQQAQVGGDFYDVFEARHGLIGLLIGDVSGHGIEAARAATLVKDTVHAFTHQFRHPRLVLRETNRLLVERNLPGFVTTFLGLLDPKRGMLVYSCAGHPPPLLAQGDEISLLESIGPPLGVFADTSYRDVETEVTEGSRLLFYTDGITEVRRDGDLFGEERLSEVFGRVRGCQIATVPSLLLEEALLFSGGLLQDDVALLVIDYVGMKAD